MCTKLDPNINFFADFWISYAVLTLTFLMSESAGANGRMSKKLRVVTPPVYRVQAAVGLLRRTGFPVKFSLLYGSESERLHALTHFINGVRATSSASVFHYRNHCDWFHTEQKLSYKSIQGYYFCFFIYILLTFSFCLLVWWIIYLCITTTFIWLHDFWSIRSIRRFIEVDLTCLSSCRCGWTWFYLTAL